MNNRDNMDDKIYKPISHAEIENCLDRFKQLIELNQPKQLAIFLNNYRHFAILLLESQIDPDILSLKFYELNLDGHANKFNIARQIQCSILERDSLLLTKAVEAMQRMHIDQNDWKLFSYIADQTFQIPIEAIDAAKLEKFNRVIEKLNEQFQQQQHPLTNHSIPSLEENGEKEEKKQIKHSRSAQKRTPLDEEERVALAIKYSLGKEQTPPSSPYQEHGSPVMFGNRTSDTVIISVSTNSQEEAADQVDYTESEKRYLSRFK